MTALARDISCPDNAANQKGLRSLDASAGPRDTRLLALRAQRQAWWSYPPSIFWRILEGQRGYDRLTAIPARHVNLELARFFLTIFSYFSLDM